MPKNFEQIVNAMQQARDAGGLVPEINVQQFSQLANFLSGTNDYAAGDTGAFARGLQYADMFKNRALEASGASDLGAKAGGYIYDLFGQDRAAGEEAGRAGMRMAADMIPLTVGTALSGGTLLAPAALAGLGGSSLMTAAGTLGQTGDAGQAAVSAAMLPGAMVAGGVGGALGQAVAQRFAPALTKAAGFTGSQLGMLGGLGEVHNVQAGKGLFANPFPTTTEGWLEAGVTQLPLFAFEAARHILPFSKRNVQSAPGTETSREQAIRELSDELDNLSNNPPPTPPAAPPAAAPPGAPPASPAGLANPTPPTTPPVTPAGPRVSPPPPKAAATAKPGAAKPQDFPPSQAFTLWTADAHEQAAADIATGIATNDPTITRAVAAEQASSNRNGPPDDAIERAVAAFEKQLMEEERSPGVPKERAPGQGEVVGVDIEGQPLRESDIPDPNEGPEGVYEEGPELDVDTSPPPAAPVEPKVEPPVNKAKPVVEPAPKAEPAPEPAAAAPVETPPAPARQPLGLDPTLPGEDSYTDSLGRRYRISKKLKESLPPAVAELVTEWNDNHGHSKRDRGFVRVKETDKVSPRSDATYTLINLATGQRREFETAGDFHGPPGVHTLPGGTFDTRMPGGDYPLPPGGIVVEKYFFGGKPYLTIHVGKPLGSPELPAPKPPKIAEVEPADLKTGKDVVAATRKASAVRKASGRAPVTDAELQEATELDATINGSADPTRVAAAVHNEAADVVTGREQSAATPKRTRLKRGSPEWKAATAAGGAKGGRPKGVSKVAEAANERFSAIINGEMSDTVKRAAAELNKMLKDPGKYLPKAKKETGAETRDKFANAPQQLINWFVKWHDEKLPGELAGKTPEEQFEAFRRGATGGVINNAAKADLYGAPYRDKDGVVVRPKDVKDGKAKADRLTRENKDPEIEQYTYVKSKDAIVPVFKSEQAAKQHRADAADALEKKATDIVGKKKAKLRSDRTPEGKIASKVVDEAATDQTENDIGVRLQNLTPRQLANNLKTLYPELRASLETVVATIEAKPEKRREIEQLITDRLMAKIQRERAAEDHPEEVYGEDTGDESASQEINDFSSPKSSAVNRNILDSHPMGLHNTGIDRDLHWHIMASQASGKPATTIELFRILQNDKLLGKLATTILEQGHPKDYNIPVTFAAKGNTSYYDPLQHAVVLSPAASRQTLFHELLHAITLNRLDVRFAYKTSGPQYLADVLEAARRNDGTGESALARSYIEYIAHLRKTDPDIVQRVNTDKVGLDAQGDYAAFNLHEFIAEAFSNPDFQDKLNQIRSDQGNFTLWSRFVSAIKQMLGMEVTKGSLLAHTIDAVEQVIKAPKNADAVAAFNRVAVKKGLTPMQRVDRNELDILRPQIGNKRAWMEPRNIDLYRSLLEGKSRVLDTFSGTGLMSRLAHAVGFRGEIVENEIDPRIHAARVAIQKNPVLIDQAKQLANDLLATKSKEEYNAALKAFPDQNLARFVGVQIGFMGSNRNVDIVPNYDRPNNLKTLSDRLESWRAQGTTLESRDGFKRSAEAQKGDLLVFDPPYTGTRSYDGGIERRTGVEEMRAATQRGADVLYFNAYDKNVERSLKDLGLNTRRERIGDVDTLVAWSKPKPVEVNFATRKPTEATFDPSTSSDPELLAKMSLPTAEDVVFRSLRKQGWTKDQIDQVMPTFTKLKEFLSLDDVMFGEIIGNALHEGREVMGLTVTNDSVRRIFLGASKELAKRGKSEQAKLAAFYFAHEGGHAVETLGHRGVLDPLGQAAYDAWFAKSEEMTPQEMREVLQLAAQSYVGKELRESPEMQEILSTTSDPSEFRANLTALWSMGKTGADTMLGSLLMPAESRGWLHTLARVTRQIFGSIRSALMVHDKAADATFKGLVKNMDELRRSFDAAQWKMEMFRGFFSGGADDIPQMQASALRAATAHTATYQEKLLAQLASRRLGPESKKDKVLRTASMWLEQTEQLVQRVPELKAMGAQVFRFPEFIKSFIHQTRGRIVGGLDTAGVPTHRGREYEQYRAVSQEVDPVANKLLGDLARYQQTRTLQPDGTGGITYLDWAKLGSERPDLHARLRALPKAKQEAIVGTLTNMSTKAMRFMQDKVVDTLKETAVNRTALMMAYEKPSMFNDLYQLATDLHRNVFFRTKQMDPQTEAMVAQSEAQLIATFGPDSYAKLMEHAQKSWEAIDAQEAKFEDRRGYLPEIRVGNFEVMAFKPNSNPWRMHAVDLNEARKLAKQAERDGFTNPTITKLERQAGSLRMTDEMRDMLADYTAKEHALIDSLGLPADAAAQLKNLDVVQMLQDHVNAAKVFDGVLREHTPGREHLDMVKTFDAYTAVLARALSHKLMKSRLMFERLRPELQETGEQLKQLEMVANNMLVPDTELGKAITLGQGVYFLAGNIPNMTAEFFQPFISVVPELISKGEGVFSANKMALKAMSDTLKVVTNMAKRRMGDASMDVFKDLPPDEAAMLKWRAETGGLGHGYLTEIFDAGMDSAIDARILGDGKTSKLMSLGKMAATPARAFADVTMRAYAAFQHNNEMTALLLGYRQAKKAMGAKFDQQKAYDAAVEFTRTVTYSAGRAGRSAMPWNGSGRLMAHAVLGLQKFFLSWVSQYARYVQHGWGAKDSPLTPAERAAARKAAYSMLAVQLGAAGAMGLPFAGAALTLLEKLTGTPFRARIYELAGSMFGEDSKAGGVLADVVMRGAADSLVGQLGVPVNMSRRFGLDGVLGFNEYDGFTAANFFGPTGSMVKSLFAGASDIAKDHDLIKAARDVAPMPFRKAIDLMINGGDVKTAQGSVVPGLTTKEKIFTAMGFQSDKARRLADAERFVEDAKVAQTEAEKKIVSGIVSKLDSNPAAARAEFRDAIEGRKLYAPALADKIADAAVKQQFPIDIRTSATRSTADTVKNIILGTGAPLPEPQNMDILRVKQRVMEVLGRDAYRPDVRHAMALDEMQRASAASPTAQLFSQPRFAGRHPSGQPF